ncbi:MAG: galactose-1-phosphate uridylyltransferase [Deltaproteobacteria bacterium]|nr:galactose-1-phosphate uridylyltransferase [Deltaproteobacteria bacterium]
MADLRKDPIVNRWVIVDPTRPERQEIFRPQEPQYTQVLPCPFCPGNEGQEPEIYAVRPPGSAPNTPGWLVRIVPDRHPMLRIEGDLDRRAEGMFDLMSALGAHELVVETPEHDLMWPETPPEHLERVLEAYQVRCLDLRKDPRFRQIVVLKNHGYGVSAFQHPHSHIVALPVVPKGIDEELWGASAHYSVKERCVFCDIIRDEIRLGRRLVLETRLFVSYAPFAPRFPFELWILPKRHEPDFGGIGMEERQDLAQVLKTVLSRLGAIIPNLSSSLILHTSPLHEFGRDEYHWHIEVLPKLARVAGFEWATGFFINPVPPEEAAARLRGDPE